jgi:hypothetical protein
MTDTDSDRRSHADEGENAVDQNPSDTDVPYGDGTTADDAASDVVVGGPDAESSSAEVQEPESVHTENAAVAERETAPQSPYTMRDVGIGAVVTVLGLILAFVLPVLLV